uniref:Putative reverse transcriptase domain-containing protein n=1 Tax=Tanacetum cinerariifolium TaxID=118510 RepID=A0A6L2MW58_TANCI|nr:putative reverse transcriptase domain-containing protein [Tanacetum cinerariifolium]
MGIDEMVEATLLSLTLHKTALIAEAQENIAKVQEKLDEEEIDKMVKGSTDDESYATIFAYTILNDECADVDDTGNKIEPGGQNENPKRVSNDDEIEKEKVGKVQNIVEKKVVNETNVEAEKIAKVVKEKEVTDEVVNVTEKIQDVLKHCDTIVPELTVAKTNEMIKKEMPRLVKLAVDKDREVSYVDISGMVSKEFAAHGPKLIEELFWGKHCEKLFWKATKCKGIFFEWKTNSTNDKASGAMHCGKKGKLAPRLVGPFEITEQVGLVAYRLKLPQELTGVHDTFHVSNLKKCLAHKTLHVPFEEIRIDAKLHFIEEPVEIMDREIKKLKRSRILIVNVRWNSK